MARNNWTGRKYALAALALAGVATTLWLVLVSPSQSEAGLPQDVPTLSDTGILTEWALPPDRGPWQLKWDSLRSLIWFAEGTHSNPPLDQLGSIDPATGVLREWGIPTSGGYVHGTALDRDYNVWFTEVRQNRIGRLEPDTNTITEWPLDPAGFPHGIAVDDAITDSVKVWFSERDADKISSIDLATGVYQRHANPFPGSWPHSVVIGPDRGVWFVETCGNRVGRLTTSGGVDEWKFWQPPTAGGLCSPPNNIGPLFGNFVNGDFWYSEPYNGRIIRLQPSENKFTMWSVPGAGGGSRLITQPVGDPQGNIYFPEMTGNRIGRLEPVGATTPTMIVVMPTTVSQAAPAEATSVPVSVVYTPVVRQLTAVSRTLTGTRNGSIVEWALPTIPPTPGRRIGPGRAWYGDGAMWIAELTASKIGRFAPYTSTPGAATATVAATLTATFTPTGTATRTHTSTQTGTPTSVPATNTPTQTPTTTPTGTFIPPSSTQAIPSNTSVPASATNTAQPTSTTVPATGTSTSATASATATQAQPSPTSCAITFSDVPPDNVFYSNIRCLACRGIISGYADGTFRPNNEITRSQIAKIVSNAAGFDEDPGAQIYEDVDQTNPFYAWINRLSMRGHMGGYPCGTTPEEPCNPPENRPYFRPFANATRGQLAKIVSNAGGIAHTPSGQYYTDVPEDNPFYTWIMRLTDLGVMSGYQCGGEGEPCDGENRAYFRPSNNVTRGQASKIVANTFYPDCQPAGWRIAWGVSQSDASWFYCDIGVSIGGQR